MLLDSNMPCRYSRWSVLVQTWLLQLIRCHVAEVLQLPEWLLTCYGVASWPFAHTSINHALHHHTIRFMSYHVAEPWRHECHIACHYFYDHLFFSRSFETISFFSQKMHILPCGSSSTFLPMFGFISTFSCLCGSSSGTFLRLFLLFSPQLVLLPFIYSRALHAVSSGCGWCSACSWCGARCSVSGPNHDLEVWCGVVHVHREGLGHLSP